MTRSPEDPIGMSRIIELVSTLGDDHFALGPLDRQDLQALCCELLERRNQHVVPDDVTVTMTKAGLEKLISMEMNNAAD
jgi:hypothetical protein